MFRNVFTKEKLSIHNIGKFRFYAGFGAGIFSAISLSLAFNYMREAYRFTTYFFTDLMILSANELIFFNYFFATLATVLGLSITIWIWMGNHRHKRRIERVFKQLSQTYALLLFWVVLMLVARFSHIFSILLFTSVGYDGQLNLYEEFRIIFLLLPLVLFLQNWYLVRLSYRAGKWIIISFAICSVVAIALAYTTKVDQEIINKLYFERFEKDYEYIDNEVSRAEKEYGIIFPQETIDILKKWHTPPTIEQVQQVKKAFERNKPVSIDTIILQKMIIRNLKQGQWLLAPMNDIFNWHYALPNDILKQIEMCHITSKELKEIFAVLKEQIELVNLPEIDFEKRRDHTQTEIRRANFGSRYIPEAIIDQLKYVIATLSDDDRYSEMVSNLPPLNRENL